MTELAAYVTGKEHHPNRVERSTYCVGVHEILQSLVVAFPLPGVDELLPQRRSAGSAVRDRVLLLDELVERPAQLGDRLAHPIPDLPHVFFLFLLLVLELVDHFLELGVVPVEPVAVRRGGGPRLVL